MFVWTFSIRKVGCYTFLGGTIYSFRESDNLYLVTLEFKLTAVLNVVMRVYSCWRWCARIKCTWRGRSFLAKGTVMEFWTREYARRADILESSWFFGCSRLVYQACRPRGYTVHHSTLYRLVRPCSVDNANTPYWHYCVLGRLRRGCHATRPTVYCRSDQTAYRLSRKGWVGWPASWRSIC